MVSEATQPSSSAAKTLAMVRYRSSLGCSTASPPAWASRALSRREALRAQLLGSERSAWSVDRIKQFSADDLLALSRGFDLPIGFFFTPPPPELDAALHAPDAPMAGLDPIVILDAILGTPENLGYWREELLAYASSTAPPPQTKREKPHVTPADLPDRIDPIAATRARALLRHSFGDLEKAKDVLERLAELAGALEDTTPDDTTNHHGARSGRGGRTTKSTRSTGATPRPRR